MLCVQTDKHLGISRFLLYVLAYLVRSFFRLGLSMRFPELDLIGQIASFERRLRGAAQMALALPYPFRTWPG